jgi:hypothetical protein
MFRLCAIKGSRQPILNSTETTIPCADPSQNKYGCRSLGETLPHIGTASLFTNRMKGRLSQYGFNLLEILKRRNFFLQPGGFS